MLKISIISLILSCGLIWAPACYAQKASELVDKDLAQIDLKLSQSPNNFDLLVRKAHRLGALRRYNEELLIANRAVAQSPHERDAYYVLMEAEQGLENTSAALAALGKMMQLAPSESNYILRAHIYSQAGRFKEALADANRALKSFPDRATLYLVRSRCLYRLNGPCQESVDDLERALKLEPSNATIPPLLNKIKKEMLATSK